MVDLLGLRCDEGLVMIFQSDHRPLLSDAHTQCLKSLDVDNHKHSKRRFCEVALGYLSSQQ